MDKYQQIKRIFEAHQDPCQAVRMAHYMRDQFIFYGIPSQSRKVLTRPLIKEEKQQGMIDWAFLDQCYQDEHREFQYLVCDYLDALKKSLCYEDLSHIRTYLVTRSWWDTTDALDLVVGSLGLWDKRVNDLMLAWSTDENIWLRRVAIDHQLLRKEKTDTELLEKILVNQWGSQEFFINKAVGWILRDYSKTDPDWVRAFISRHETKMHPLSIREGSKYL